MTQIQPSGEVSALNPTITSTEWLRFTEVVQSQVKMGAWQTWIQRLEPSFDGTRLTLTAPSDFHLRWVVDKHGQHIEQAVLTAYGSDVEIEFTIGEPSEDIQVQLAIPGDITIAHNDPLPSAPPAPERVARLVRKYRFENFVVGQSNRFASAAAMAVAEQPGAHYNPLFIHGNAGLGKTHLLNAIGYQALEMYAGMEVRYVTSETFFTDFINSIRRKRMDEFKARYRTTDILLLDDVQFFNGKEQILEEFFHTFNSLYESGKQIVITSDRHPRNLTTLEDRLRSRFEWGLLTDIQPPDVETRLAILRRNAEHAPTPVPIEVLEFIAGLVSDNIRELEGALTRVTAFASLTGEGINHPMAERVLQDMLPGHESKAVNAPEIMSATAAAYGFTVSELEGPSRKQPLARCRQVAMYLCREHTDLSLPKIGRHFGNRDHTTVMHAIEKVKSVMQTDREVFDRVSELSQSLRKR